MYEVDDAEGATEISLRRRGPGRSGRARALCGTRGARERARSPLPVRAVQGADRARLTPRSLIDDDGLDEDDEDEEEDDDEDEDDEDPDRNDIGDGVNW